ncbi:hypothetical protein [Neobacillus soli]|uniref:hypothetical protein n=1 Tax=Neobacillus soli TaxID=220688 RepID=UPI000826E99C|nr:hypothetical protein [Neobacillus soli]
MKRLLTVALSVVLFATIFSWVSYVPSSQRESNAYYFGFLETFILVIIYAGPVYFLVGLPLSIFIDKLIEKSNRKSKWAKYFFGLGLYSLIGTLIGVIFPIIFGQNIFQQEVISLSIYGIAASNFYFHLSLLIPKIIKK